MVTVLFCKVHEHALMKIRNVLVSEMHCLMFTQRWIVVCNAVSHNHYLVENDEYYVLNGWITTGCLQHSPCKYLLKE